MQDAKRAQFFTNLFFNRHTGLVHLPDRPQLHNRALPGGARRPRRPRPGRARAQQVHRQRRRQGRLRDHRVHEAVTAADAANKPTMMKRICFGGRKN